jgi:hypothetical protein
MNNKIMLVNDDGTKVKDLKRSGLYKNISDQKEYRDHHKTAEALNVLPSMVMNRFNSDKCSDWKFHEL